MPKNQEAEKNNPCLKEQNLTYKCLNDNAFDKEKCQAYYKNYQNCKDFWGFVQSDRRKKRIRPLLPPPEERAQIKTEYFEQYTKQT